MDFYVELWNLIIFYGIKYYFYLEYDKVCFLSLPPLLPLRLYSFAAHVKIVLLTSIFYVAIAYGSNQLREDEGFLLILEGPTHGKRDLSVNTITYERVEIQPSTLKPDGL